MHAAPRLSNLAYATLLLLACGSPQESAPPREPPREPVSPEGTSPSPPVAGHVVEGFWTAEGAPPPLACAADADCGYGGAVDDTGCCWSYRDMNAVAQSHAYATWLSSYRERSCANVSCPSPPVPSQPPDCLFAVRCETGRCVNACGPTH